MKIGDVLVQRFLEPNGITGYKLAKDLGYNRMTVNNLINGKSKLTVPMGIRIARYFGMPDRYFIDIQIDMDIEDELSISDDINKIKPFDSK